MAMKTSNAPRRIYTRNSVVHVCFDGRYFGPGKDSTISLEHPVTLEKMPSNGKRARCQVTQKRRGKATIVEEWSSVKVPRTVRG